MITGADPGFQARGVGHLKNLRRAVGGAKSFGVFRVKNHDFTPKFFIFSNFRGEGRASGAPPPESAPGSCPLCTRQSLVGLFSAISLKKQYTGRLVASLGTN